MENKKIALISLGCSKNQINSEQMLCLLDDAGAVIVPEPEGADAVVINTCGFIDAAKSEAIDNILECCELKKEGLLGKIIVCGCLAQRYKDEIKKEIPEVDAILGVGSYKDIVDTLKKAFEGEYVETYGDKNAPVDEIGRYLTSGPGWAYIKIAEGCSNCCAFCAIPSIRGKYRSRPMENIIAEAKALAEAGCRELIIIAQDITRYGTDLYGERKLHELLKELSAIEEIHWLRLHYLYPDELGDELIEEIASNDKICKYLDIPIQHISTPVLKRMNRRDTGDSIKALFSKLREKIPGLVLRTSLITGFPGETEEDFEELCEFLKEARIERVGVFPYSPEEGTPAASMPDRPDTEVAERRAELIMELQAGIMEEYNESRLGQELEVLCCGNDGGYLIGRTYADSHEVDGIVYFEGDCEEGDFTRIRITGLMDDELCGEQI